MKNTLVLFAATLMILAGCAHAPEAKAYLTLKDTWETEKAAFQVYAMAAAEGKVSTSKQAKIDDAHDRFRAAMLVAIETARFDYSAPTPESLTRLATEVIRLIQELQL